MGYFNGHHTLWGCEEVNNRGKQLEDLILKNYFTIFNDKSSTYFHPASDTFTSIDLTLCRPTLYLLESWSRTLVVVTTLQLFWRMVDHLLMKGFGDGTLGTLSASVQDTSTPICHYGMLIDPMPLFTSILKERRKYFI